MSSSSATTVHPKVFLSFPWSDKRLAEDVSAALAGAGLEVLSSDKLTSGGIYSDQIRNALHRADAVVVVLSDIARRREISANVLFEIGAGVGARKPIYVVIESMNDGLPFNVPNLHLLPMSRLGEIAQELSANGERASND